MTANGCQPDLGSQANDTKIMFPEPEVNFPRWQHMLNNGTWMTTADNLAIEVGNTTPLINTKAACVRK